MTLQELVDSCKASVHVDFNPHKAYYETVREHIITHQDTLEQLTEEVGEERINRLFSGDVLVTLQWYPNTPVGFCMVYGQTLEECLEQVDIEGED